MLLGRLHAKVPFLEQNQSQMGRNYIAMVNDYFIVNFVPFLTGEKVRLFWLLRTFYRLIACAICPNCPPPPGTVRPKRGGQQRERSGRAEKGTPLPHELFTANGGRSVATLFHSLHRPNDRSIRIWTAKVSERGQSEDIGTASARGRGGEEATH